MARALHPNVSAWFDATFDAPSEVQRQAIEAHGDGSDLLLSSPTGSGKSLAGFLGALSDLLDEADAGRLIDGVQCLYISPLRALNADVARNLEAPLEGIASVARANGKTPPNLRVGIRMGDTDLAERRRQAVAPPHILATTPETLAILLNAPRFSLALPRVKRIIVDEVHALVGTKRGAHLALSLARVDRLVARTGASRPVRVGLSATVGSPERVARFLSGSAPCRVVAIDGARDLDLVVRDDVAQHWLEPASFEDALHGLLHEIIQKHRSTLVFTSTRRAAERVVQGLRERFPEYSHALEDTESTDPAFSTPDTSDGVAPHHGSLSRESRWIVEAQLKRGDLKCVVASASLELGIDIGAVEHVVLLGSPRDPARALQRIGRSGHSLGLTPSATLVALDPEDWLECQALAAAIRRRELPQDPATAASPDVLAQHIVGMTLEGPLHPEDILEVARATDPYCHIEKDDVARIVHTLIQERLLRGGAKGRLVRGPAASLQRYATNVGVIASSRSMRIRVGDRFIGEVDEAFGGSLSPGDVFQLAGESWRFLRAVEGTAWVAAAPGEPPTMPRWASEGAPVAAELLCQARKIRDSAEASFRQANHASSVTVSQTPGISVAWPLHTPGNVESGVIPLWMRRWVGLQSTFADPGAPQEVRVETFPDAEGRRVTVLHAPVGRRANEVLGRALAARRERAGLTAPRVMMSDHGFALAIPRGEPDLAKEIMKLAEEGLTSDDIDALTASPRFQKRFRQVADRFLLARTPAARGPPAALAARDARLKSDPDSPVIREALRETLHEALDIDGARTALAALRSGAWTLARAKRLPCASPYAAFIVTQAEPAPALERVQAHREIVEHAADALALSEKRGAASHGLGG